MLSSKNVEFEEDINLTKFFSKTPKIFIWYLYSDINKSLNVWIEKNKQKLKGLNLQLLSRYKHSYEDLNKKEIESKWHSDVLENITIHKSKGLAIDVVMIPFNWEDSKNFQEICGIFFETKIPPFLKIEVGFSSE